MAKMIRLATTSNGDRYVVQRLTIGATSTTVHCWGEVTAFKTGKAASKTAALDTSTHMSHAASVNFDKSEVTISEVAHDGHLAKALLDQARRNIKPVPVVPMPRLVDDATFVDLLGKILAVK